MGLRVADAVQANENHHLLRHCVVGGGCRSGGSGIAADSTHKKCQDDDGEEQHEVQNAGNPPLLVEHLPTLSTRTDQEPGQSGDRQKDRQTANRETEKIDSQAERNRERSDHSPVQEGRRRKNPRNSTFKIMNSTLTVGERASLQTKNGSIYTRASVW